MTPHLSQLGHRHPGPLPVRGPVGATEIEEEDVGPRREKVPPARGVVSQSKRLTGTSSAGVEGCLLDYEGAAEYLCTTPRHVRKLWETRQLTAIKVGRCVRFAITDLDAFIATNRVAAIRQAHRCRTWP